MFKWMAETGNIAEAEMLKTFNCGVGMVLSVDAARADALSELLQDKGETVLRLGHVTDTGTAAYTGSLL